MAFTIEPIGTVISPYKEKFAVPRQPRLVPAATATIELSGSANCAEAIKGIEQFTHLWIVFLFDQNIDAGWKPTVRPPRLGGNERMGVLATRSTFRPNSIGMSAVELKSVEQRGAQTLIHLGSVDLVDGTPIIDIKPYIPYSDSIPHAQGGYASEEPELIDVQFTPDVDSFLSQNKDGDHKRQVISQVLAQDPRPAYRKGKADHKEYGVKLYDWNVKFKIMDESVLVTTIEPL
ncbi:tRNA-Thr(GGU) m(6)t(6)A37 methyltransferase TsaA [Vibrio sp. 10N.286.49.C2]|uniref:tRNA (N6-threonylcarbamoyladenosine(37)-N6)-methyltransferase TrmO n=1 Tax=unclassified Vibrio TaxID=2614977 RepID=UPI000C82CF5B|nr:MULTISPECIES: tRNA (N6-threonylcarbamoyladenosine(37)-N6)-methyltransferase TrmO [unclassified Vibrio]PMH36311.1 tRNA-Thr(GGU) m(6)t(6)A37 methyltransferase TsaA [Vibrio sp. 10N.286.49.C2]PMH53427.1 tRNA-Thr(GGU) m(6)t(6)A37 methyltransferase TsaA [Vibrio sp. 10N.286.49.B1]PMH78100.1 tRNA-Thr(GGU) m(6)t(6)A37 methyltransferase TsaA [Vibrio sp. 10N.286.48.B7]